MKTTKIFIFLSLLIFFACSKEGVTPRTDLDSNLNFTYMYFDQYDFDGRIGTSSNIIVVNPDNLRDNFNSGARQIANPGEFEEDFDNYDGVIVDNAYLINNCWGIGDFSAMEKDVTGDGKTEQVFGGSIISDNVPPTGSFDDAVSKDLGETHGNLELNSEDINNIKVSGNPDAVDVLTWVSGFFPNITPGERLTIWADVGQTITIQNNYPSTAQITTISGENETLNEKEYMVIELDNDYSWFEVGQGSESSIQFYSRPFHITGDISIKLEDLYLETSEDVKMEIFLTWEDGEPYNGNTDPIYTTTLVNGLNVLPPDNTKGFYTIDLEFPDPVYYTRLHFVFTSQSSYGVWIDGFHIEGPGNINDGGCGYNSLPIEITEFKCYKEKDGKVINLFVETGSEINAHYMQFYGSFDAETWIPLEDLIECDNRSWGSHYKIVYDLVTGSLIRVK